jgi:alginate O-acetyltransferase complex protein AlgI
MNFSSLLFIFFFFPAFLLVFNLVPKKYKKLVLLVFSIVFYLYSGLFNFIVLIALCLINYFVTNIIDKFRKLKFLYIVLIIVNIITLLIFKYNKSLLFPLGISFYIFNSLSYIIDLKREKIKAEKNIINYLTYVMLFTHVTMGPITRYDSIMDNLNNYTFKADDFFNGFRRFMNGLIKKVLIADNLGLLFGNLLTIQNTSSVLNIYILIVYALELYIDFSSYCDMAIGIGKMIGIKYKENFDYPYLSTSISEFWRRWHISLGEFFKEYVYFPMGGNRVSVAKNIFNLFVVWLLTGIWHGNTINFLLWGIYYWIIIVIEKYLLKKLLDKAPGFIKHIYVILIVLIGYIFFIGVDILPYIKGIFNSTIIDKTAIFFIKENIVLVLIGIILCFRFPNKLREKINSYKVSKILIPIVYIALFILVLSYIISGSFQPFLYNNF